MERQNDILINSDVLEELTGRELNDKIASLSALNCKKCKGVLRPPIVVVKYIGHVCGTCSESFDDDLSTPNQALEVVLGNIVFPCKYKKNGCDNRFNFAKIKMHELVCNYRNISCPLRTFSNCTWSQSLNLLEKHFTVDHRDDIVKKSEDYFKVHIDVTKDSKWVKVLYDPKDLFILHFEYNLEDSKFGCVLLRLKDENEFLDHNYMVWSEGSEDRTARLVLQDVDFTSYTLYTNHALSIYLPPTYDSESKHTLNVLIEALDKNNISDEELQMLECFVCNNYMKSPIFQCTTGHSICNVCKSKVVNCPLCRASFGNTRNFAFEKLSNTTYFPCTYRTQGCEVVETGRAIVDHEKKCPQMLHSCPITNLCNWEGLYQKMLEHISIHFINDIKNNPCFGTIILTEENCTFYMIAYNRLFRISFELHHTASFTSFFHNTESIVCVVHLIGPKDEAKLFKYELGFINSNNVEMKTVFTGLCKDEIDSNLSTPFKRLRIVCEDLNAYVKHGTTLLFYCKIIKMVDTDSKNALCWLRKLALRDTLPIHTPNEF